MIFNHFPVSAYSGVLKFDTKIFVTVARLETSQLFTQGARQGYTCTLDTFLVYFFYGNLSEFSGLTSHQELHHEDRTLV